MRGPFYFPSRARVLSGGIPYLSRQSENPLDFWRIWDDKGLNAETARVPTPLEARRNEMKRTALWMSLAGVTAILGGLVGLSMQTVGAQSVPEPGLSRGEFPVVGITRGEMARLHLVYLTEDPTAPPLNVAVKFLDRAGQPIKAEDLALEPNMTAATDLVHDDFNPGQLVEPGPRGEFRISIQAEALPCPPGTDGGSPPGTDGGFPSGGGSLVGNVEVLTHRGVSILSVGPATVIPVAIGCGPPPGTDGGTTG